MAPNYGPRIVTNGLALCLDPANSKSYPGTGTAVTDLTNNIDATIYDSGSFVTHSFSEKAFKIDRSTTPGTEGGGGLFLTGTGDLTAAQFMYNDHTIDVWCKINDRQPYVFYDNTQTTESISAILVWRGYHAGLYYSNSLLSYRVWDNKVTSIGPQISWTSLTETDEGVWFNVVARRTNGNVEIFVNGTSVAGPTDVSSAANTDIGTSDEIRIGHANIVASNYSFTADIDIGSVKLYKRSLSTDEIKQNFNAIKGRYGL